MEPTTPPSGNSELRAPPVVDRAAPHIGLNLLGGVALPLFCLLADPMFFRSWRFAANSIAFVLGQDAMFSSARVAAYSFFALQMLALTLWLCRPRQHTYSAAILAGVLFVGSAASLLLGIILLPFSLVGLMAVIGILGFSPFLVSWIYFKNAMRAYQAARIDDLTADPEIDERPPHWNPQYAFCWVAGILSVVIPYGVQSIPRQVAANVIRTAIDGDEVASAAALKRISDWKPAFRIFADTDRLAREAERNETDDKRYARIDGVFSMITDEEVWQRLATLDD